jgi:Arc/MetJ family transcription regulator
VLDGEILEEALRLSGERTYSATVDLALREFVRRARAERILELAGSGLWHGDLGEMRGDWAVGERKPRGRRRGSR